MGADIRKAVDLFLRVPLEEERFSQEREGDSRTWSAQKLVERSRIANSATRDEHPIPVEYRV